MDQTLSKGRHIAGGLTLCATLVLAIGCGAPSGPSPLPSPSPSPPPPPKVVVISIDGLRPDALGLAGATNVLGLAQRGAFTWKARTVFPSVTLVAHASMLSGVAPDVHGISWDDYRPDRGCISVPTVFGVAHDAGQRTVLVAGKQKFQHLNVPGTIDRFLLTPRGDADIANEAVVQVQAGFDLLFVHFPDTDLAGHTSGWLSSVYLARLAEADRAVGRLLGTLPPETTVILTADHGGHATNHGTAMTEDMAIPWIIAGPRVPGRGREIQATVRTADTAVTALYVLGIAAPTGVAGQVVGEAFVP